MLLGWTQYLTANKITDAGLKRSTMLTLIGADAFELLCDLLAPDAPTDKSFNQLKAALQGHLSPQPLVIGERYRFYQRDQRSGESIATYVAELRRLSRTCSFGAHLPEALRDRFVCGLRSAATRRKLLAAKDLTFEAAVTAAKADELAVRDAEEVHVAAATDMHRSSSAGLHQLRSKPKASAKPRPSSQSCYRCGNTGHSPAECRFKDVVCRACNKRGHLQKVCRSSPGNQSVQPAPARPVPKPRRHRAPVHQVEDSQERRDERTSGASLFFSDEEPIHYVNVGHLESRPPAPYLVTATVNGVDLQMEVDTGAAISILPASWYDAHFASESLRPSTLRLTAYNGQAMPAQGVFTASVTVNGETARADLHVVDTTGPPLLGRAWLNTFRLDWTKIKNVATSSDHRPTALVEIKSKYADVFSEEQGCLKGVKAKLTLKRYARPKFVKARLVALSLQPRVEAEIWRMEDAGVLTRVQWSEWATPVVPVVKPNGKVRLCGDFKVTLNPQLHVDQHPLPLIDDVFASLSGGTHFTKIDLKAAYTQMELEETSKPLATLNTHLGLFRLNRLAYGVASAPALWQRAMDQLLAGIPRTKCTIDDIIITGRDDSEHLNNLEEVLKRLSAAGLRVNPSKCAFFQPKVEYCGHAVSAQGLHQLPSKVEAICNAPPPETVTQVRSFVGMVNYYQRFLPDLASILSPITALLQQGQTFYWTKDCQHAFQRVKQMLASDQVLTHYDPSLPIRVASDASPYGIGAVLSHILPL